VAQKTSNFLQTTTLPFPIIFFNFFVITLSYFLKNGIMFLISLFNFILYFDSVIIPSKNYKQRKSCPMRKGICKKLLKKPYTKIKTNPIRKRVSAQHLELDPSFSNNKIL